MKTVFLLFACLPALAADDIESLHNFVWEGRPAETVSAQLLGQLRLNNHFHSVAQFQGGPMFTLRRWDQVRPLAGYYFIETENSRKDYEMVHRPFVGVIFPIWRGSTSEISSRTLVERIISTQADDYTRTRERIGWRWRRAGTSPYCTAEVLYSLTRWLMRYEAGASWTIAGNLSLLAGYQYRQYRDGHAGHVMVTTLQFGGVSQTGR